MELTKITDQVYYLGAPANIGLLATPSEEILLIDAGLDESTGKKVYRQLEAHGFQLKGIIITHAHADHFGGAEFLLKKTQAKLYAPPMESSVIQHPLWEPIYLFGGAHPPLAMQNKFLLGPASSVWETLSLGEQTVEGIQLEIVPLPGHSWQQIGVSYNQVLFCADAIFASEVLEKHGIPLFSHLEAAWQTFDLLINRPEKYFLPAHGPLVEDIRPVVEANKSCLQGVENYIFQLLQTPLTTEKILAACCQEWGVNLTSQGQYYLMQATVLAYLSYLFNQKKISTVYENNQQFWQQL